MGLDGVELVMEIEEEFGITIRDDEAERTQTVGQLIQLVEAKLTPESRRQLGAAFYRLRQVLADAALIDKRLITPGTDLRPFIPESQVPSVWKELREAGFRVPSLTFSRRGRFVFFFLWLACIVLTIKVVSYLIPVSGSVLGAAVASLFFGWIPIWCIVAWLGFTPLFPSLAAIPASHATAGALARRWTAIAATSSSDSGDQQAVAAPADENDDHSVRSKSDGDALEARREEALARLKEVLHIAAGLVPAALDPSTSLKDALPRRLRWRVWKLIEEAGAPILPLRLTWFAKAIIAVPVLAVALFGAVVIIGMFVLLVGAGQIGSALIAVGAGLIAVLLFSSGVERALLAFGRARQAWWLVSDIPEEWSTLDRAARWLAEHGWPYTPPEFHLRSRSIALRVRQLVAEQAQMPLDKVQPESRFVHDLGF